MIRSLTCLILIAGLAVPASGQLKDTYVIVKQNDFAGVDSYAVMTEKEFRKLDSELRKEGFMATRARIMAAKVWSSDKEKEGRFPAGMISARRASKVGRVYRERDDAENKLSDLESRLMEKEREDAEREKRRVQNREKIRSNALRGSGGGGRHNSSSMSAATRDRLKRRAKERDQANEMREAEREMERDALKSDAVAIYEAQIEILKNPPPKEDAVP